MRTAAECLGKAEDMHTKSLGCEKLADRIDYAEIADGWRCIAELAEECDRWRELCPEAFS